MPTGDNLLKLWLVLAIGIAGGSYTVTRAGIFRPLRDLLERKSKWLGELINCPYCFAHWMVFAAAAWVQEPVIEGNWFVAMLVTILAVSCVVSLLHFVMLRTYKTIIDEIVMKRQAADSMQEAAAALATEMGHEDVAKAIVEELKII